MVRSLRHQIEASPGYHVDMTVMRSHSPHTAMSLGHRSGEVTATSNQSLTWISQ